MSTSPTPPVTPTVELAILPLTERRRGYLEDLIAERPVGWVSTITMNWAIDAGLVGPVEPSVKKRITDLGRRALELDEQHSLSLSSRVLGRSPIRGLGSTRGSNGRCRCGERWQNNEPPTKGGHKRITQQHREHVNALLAAR